ncbi:MAG: hypothetical protein IPO67_20140 [Deltaproteobacteria bacterium]|nr:hypothetical protein [Deltaproteobacteria bacterium]
MILTLSAALFEGTSDDERTGFWKLIYALDESPIPHALLLDTTEDVSAGQGPVAAWLAPEARHQQMRARALFESGLIAAASIPAAAPSTRAGCWRRAGPLQGDG